MLFGRKKETRAGTATDPICKMTVETTTHRQVEHAGTMYYFCSDHCVEQFRTNPAAHAQGPRAMG